MPVKDMIKKFDYAAPVVELLELAAESPLAQSQLEQPVINPPINW